MPKAQINFHKIILDSQNYANSQGNEDHMVSIIHFDLEVNGSKYEDLTVEILQPYGTNFESDPIEVDKPIGYSGPWNHNAFSDLCEHYCREAVGSSATGIRIEGGENVRIRNCTYGIPRSEEFEIPDI